jgi:hypothetical protein
MKSHKWFFYNEFRDGEEIDSEYNKRVQKQKRGLDGT